VRESIVPASGDCRVHRAGVLRWRGAWSEAEADALTGCEELAGNVIHVGLAQYEIGEIRLRRGDLTAAEDAFARAYEMGRSPQPGLALLRLAQGKVDAAAALIEKALAEETVDLLRAPLLSARVEVALAADNRDAARDAARELLTIAESFGTTALHAATACAQGAIQLAEGDSRAAASLRRGAQLWQEIGVPCEAARARMHLAEAHVARGDTESSALELRAALSTFERLGAAPDSRRAAAALRTVRGAGEDGSMEETTLRTFMFTDIVGSTPLVEAIGDEAWGHVVRWHDEALRALFVKFEGEEIDHTGDGFFVAFREHEPCARMRDRDPANACRAPLEARLRAAGARRRARVGSEAQRTDLPGPRSSHRRADRRSRHRRRDPREPTIASKCGSRLRRGRHPGREAQGDLGADRACRSSLGVAVRRRPSLTTFGRGFSTHPPLPPLHVDRLRDLPQNDSDDEHRLGGDEMLVVDRRTLGVPLGQELILAGLRPQALAEAHLRRFSRSRSLSRLRTSRRVRVQLATRSDSTPAAGVWLATGVLRQHGFESRMRLSHVHAQA
jgi:tetratricopeptide (TPR) repeat protein